MFNREASLSIRKSERRQRGAAAIEFALVFPFILLIFYGIICYSIILLHKQAVTSISAEAARSALAAGDAAGIQAEIQNTINGYSWIADRITGCKAGGAYYTLTGNQLQVCLKATLPDNPPMPTINLSVFGLPSLPPDTTNMLQTETSVRWQP